MIGVIAPEGQQDVVREFFELFKTPWELYEEGKDYDVLLCTMEVASLPSARLTVVYGLETWPIDRLIGIKIIPQESPAELDWNGETVPIYTGLSSIDGQGIAVLTIKASGRVAGIKIRQAGRTVIRIGYDLFREVTTLLSRGQPAEYAAIPTAELHIAILRDMMREAGLTFVEIPPFPHGYELIACLTHDVDYCGIRQHKLDHTMFGFLYRATWGTLIDALKGRVAWHKLRVNLKAALSLPAVYLHLARDFWAHLDEYFEVEKGLCSTYFFLPYANVPGKVPAGVAPSSRAGRYDIRLVREQVLKLLSAGCEVGLHGIDAWHDPEKGRREIDRIVSVTGRPVNGVRMHWLYFGDQSPAVLAQTGLSYDSTCGYNDAVGFRAGTAQVYRPQWAVKLLELPLLIQDTALFSSTRMGMSEKEAFPVFEDVMMRVLRYGGVLSLNWHTRSLLPERLWGDFYVRALSILRSRATWFASAERVIKWFAARRKAVFCHVALRGEAVETAIDGIEGNSDPQLRLRLYSPGQEKCSEDVIGTDGNVVIPLQGR
jgi:hypothetical protein